MVTPRTGGVNADARDYVHSPHRQGHPALHGALRPSVGKDPSFTVAVDTEFHDAHTLTVQAACRLGPRAVAVQLYRSPDIPPLPRHFDPLAYLPLGEERYGRYAEEIVVRPVKLITRKL